MNMRVILEAMSRRGFLGRIGGAVAGLGMSRLLPQAAAASARPVGYDPNLPWTERMQITLNKTKQLFMSERTKGFIQNGRVVRPTSAAVAQQQWERIAPKFVHTFQNYDFDLHDRNYLYSGHHVEYDPTSTKPLKKVANPNQIATDVQQQKLREYEREAVTRSRRPERQQQQQQRPDQQRQQPDRQSPVLPAYGRNARELPRQTFEAAKIVDALLND